jgi:hypothetical protein
LHGAERAQCGAPSSVSMRSQSRTWR